MRLLTKMILVLGSVFGLLAPIAAASSAREYVQTLASEDWAGRFTGSKGAQEAAEYLARQLEEIGAWPLPNEDDFFLEFEFTAGTRDLGSKVQWGSSEERHEFQGEDTVRALGFSKTGSITARAVFAGYGLVVPEADGFSYDSYAGLEVDGKVVVVLRYYPEDADDSIRGRLARFSGLRYKALQARERGAVALIVITGPRSPNAGEVVPMSFDAAIADSGLVAVSVSATAAEALVAGPSGKSLEEIQESFDDANPHVGGFALSDIELTVEAKVKRERRIGRNVAGVIAGRNSAAVSAPYVILGAHYDHLGKGRSASSLADKKNAEAIHHGADDNASGVAAVLLAGRELAESEPGRSVVLAFWSGEEIGLLGSGHFVKEGALTMKEVAAYLNFDMVGRSQNNRLSVQAVGSSASWPALIEQANVPVGFNLDLQDDPYLPTDSSAFNQASVPSLNFFTGSHEDYHKPSDTADKINYEDLERVARLGASIARKVSSAETPPDFKAVERKVESGGGRDGLRAFTGTIPDYATEVEGLLLSGVIEGGPAEEGGLKGGDVIVEFGGQKIANIYDYTYALDAVRIGVSVKVVFVRDGEQKETEITPRARD